MSRVNIIFVDLQGFVVDENFRVKEIAVLKRERELTHHIFGPFVEWTLLESDDRSRASWLTHNHHGLEWDEGDIEYARAGTLIERALTVDLDREVAVYVKGLQKKRWLREILGETGIRIETMDDIYSDIGRLRDMCADGAFLCGRHANNCAMENVVKLYKWWSSHDEKRT